MRRVLPVVVLLGAVRLAAAVERFPPPQFESDHPLPRTTTPPPRSDFREYVDVAVLAAALAAASYLALRRRSRRGLALLTVFSLAYFGFYRKGCVCAIGAIQNVALGLFDATYSIPVVVLLFFALPLLSTLLFGRTFCAAVCPLGAIQDVVILRPVKVPAWLEQTLGLLPYVYLAAAVLFAATGSAFIICQYDPFVSFFRLSGDVNMLIFGAALLVAGMFVARPYCRYICPLGAVFRPLSSLSKWHVTITPDECIHCRLCEEACPFGAIDKALPEPAPGGRRQGLALLGGLILLGPVLIGGGGLLVSRMGPALSRMHYTVRLAERIRQEETGQVRGTTDASAAFRGTGRPILGLYADAQRIRSRYRLGGWIVGGFLGLVVALKLIRLSVRRRRPDYVPNRSTCLSCGRCFSWCPVDLARREGREVSART